MPTIPLFFMSNKDIISELNKLTGRNIASYATETSRVDWISSGMMTLDSVIGNGLPKGRIIELHGQPSCGKTSLCLHIIKHMQNMGKRCVFIDAEYTLDVDYCKFLGVDLSKLIVIKPEYGEEVFEVVEKIVREKAADFIVVDSVSAMVPKSRLEADTGTQAIGAQARMIANELPKLINPLEKSGCILVFINQLRVNIMGNKYDAYTTPGGMSLRHYTSVRIKVSKVSDLKASDENVGSKIKLEIVKNKVGKPKGTVELTLLFDEGFSENADLIEIAQKTGVITRLGNKYMFGETVLAIGIPKTRLFLNENPDIAEQIALAVQQSSTR